MASSPAFAAPQYAAPSAAVASANQTCDHQLVDLLWFYGCVASVPASFYDDVHIAAHTLHAASPTCAVDNKLIACAHDIKDFHSVPQHPAPHQLRSINTPSIHISPHQSPRKYGESCHSACVDIINHQASLNAADGSLDIGYLLPGGGLRCNTKGDVADVRAKVNNAPVQCLQQCMSSALPGSAKWLRQVFDTFDENKDGMLSTEELRRSLEKLGIEASFESIDTLLSHSPLKDQKGVVSREDFLLLYQGASCTQCALHYNNNDILDHIDCKTMNEDGADEELLWDAFNVFDKNKDGFISPIELQSVLCSLGFGAAKELDECTEMIKRYDQDGDGQVNFEEFKAMLNSAIKHT